MDLRLHLLGVNLTRLRCVTFTILTIVAGSDATSLLFVGGLTEGAAKDVLRLELRNVALVARHAELAPFVLLGLTHGEFGDGGGLACLPDGS